MLRALKRKIPEFRYFGLLKRIPYFISQRIFRINSDSNWPVHWSSLVFFPQNIKRKSLGPTWALCGQYIQGMNGIEIGSNVRIGPG